VIKKKKQIKQKFEVLSQQEAPKSKIVRDPIRAL
jgi:hypothetical protein